MPKIVVSTDGYGFALSVEALERLHQLGCMVDSGGFTDPNTRLPRDDARLVAMVEELGKAASAKDAFLEVVDVPDDADWYIEECEGSEWVADKRYRWPPPDPLSTL